MQPVPFARPYLGDREAAAAAEAVKSGWVVGGPRLAEFEARYAQLCEAPYAVGVSSWTTGAFLLLKAWGIGPGDEVIVPSLTFIASVNVIVHAGATPVFVDIDPETWNIDPDDVERRITPRTRAIIPIDQIGLPCDMDRIAAIAKRANLLVLQDAACSFGSRYKERPIGAQTSTTVFSLHARKVVTTGEGGMIVTFDKELAERLRRLRHQGMSLSDFARHNAPPTLFETYPEVGYNFRITDIQAAIGLVQLDKLSEMLELRRRIAQRYLDAIKAIPYLRGPRIDAGVQPNWQSFQMALDPGAPVTRDGLMNALHERGIATRRGVMASHLEKALEPWRIALPHTEEAARQCLQLPIFPALEDGQVERVIAALTDILRTH